MNILLLCSQDAVPSHTNQSISLYLNDFGYHLHSQTPDEKISGQYAAILLHSHDLQANLFKQHQLLAQQCPVILLTHSVQDNSQVLFQAMRQGASNTCELSPNPEQKQLQKLLQILPSSKEKTPKNFKKNKKQATKTQKPTIQHQQLPELCIVIGASTGGPNAMIEILKNIKDLPSTSIIILQHLEEKLSQHMAQWLSQECGHTIIHPRQEHTPKSGEIILLTDTHWTIDEQGQLHAYLEDIDKHHFKPSINFFMQSMVEHWPNYAHAALLTGMGNDGAQGLKAMQQKGWTTYAQDEGSCAVHGMPEAAVKLHAADFVQPPQHIGQSLQTSIHQMFVNHIKEKESA